MNRAVVAFLPLLLLTSCGSATEPKVQLGGLGIEVAASERAVSNLIILLLVIILVLLVALVRRRRAQPPQVQPFPTWLAQQARPADPALADLQEYSVATHWNSDDLAALRQTIENDTGINNAQRVQRAAGLGKYFAEWQSRSSVHQQILVQLMRDIRENGSGIFLSLFALAVFITLAVGISSSSFFSSLAQIDQARGLITFLVAISAVAIILLTAINIFWAAGPVEFGIRFNAAKDLVTIVMGVLGTILGFYFGSFNGDRLLNLTVDLPLNYSEVTSGAKIDVKATGKSGTAPYHFDLILVDAEGALVTRPAEDKLSNDGVINEKIDAPTTAERKKYSIILLLRDARGLQTKGAVDIIVKPKEGSGKTTPAVTPDPGAKVTPSEH